jgi:hypothetical protein
MFAGGGALTRDERTLQGLLTLEAALARARREGVSEVDVCMTFPSGVTVYMQSGMTAADAALFYTPPVGGMQ